MMITVGTGGFAYLVKISVMPIRKFPLIQVASECAVVNHYSKMNFICITNELERLGDRLQDRTDKKLLM